MNIFDLSAVLKLDKKDYDKGLTDAESRAYTWGSRVGKAAKIGAKAVAATATAIVGVSAALKKGISSTAEYGDKVDKMSQKIGISSDAYQKWDYVMQRAGTSIDSMKMGMKTLAKQAQSNSDAFQKLGISQEEVKSLNQEELFEKTVRGLAGMEQGTERAALASQLLGRAGADMAPLLNEGTKEIDKQMKMAVDYGMVMPAAAVKASAAFEDSVTTMKMTATGLKNKLMGELLPAATKVTDGLALIFKGDYTEGADKVGEGVNGIADKVLKAIPQIAKVGGKIIKAIGDSVMENLPVLTKTVVNIIVAMTTYAIQNAPMLIDAFTKILIELIKAIPMIIGKLIDTLPELLKSKGGVIVTAVLGIWTAVKAIGIVQGIMGFISTLMTVISPVGLVVAAIATAVALIILNWDKVKEVLGKVGGFFANIFKTIGSFFGKIFSAIGGFIKRMFTAGINLVKGLWNGIKSWFGNLFSKVVEKVKGIPKAVVNAVSAMYEAGVNLVKGLWQGIKDWWKNLWGDLKKKSEGLGAVTQRALDEHSPSKVFAKIGKNLVLGLDKGIKDTWGVVEDTMGTLNEMVQGGVDDELDLGIEGDDGYESVTDSFGIKTTTGSGAGTAAQVLNIPTPEDRSGRDVTVILELNRTQLARTVFRLNNEETQRVGLDLAGGTV